MRFNSNIFHLNRAGWKQWERCSCFDGYPTNRSSAEQFGANCCGEIWRSLHNSYRERNYGWGVEENASVRNRIESEAQATENFEFIPILLCFSQYVAFDTKSRDAALKFNQLRGLRQCGDITTEESNVRVVRLSELNSLENKNNYEIVCKGSRKPIDTPAADIGDCTSDATPPTGVFVRRSSTSHELDNIEHAFLALSEKFGRGGKIEDVFELFGQFETNKKDVLFSDDSSQLIPATPGSISSILQDYVRIQCVWINFFDRLTCSCLTGSALMNLSWYWLCNKEQIFEDASWTAVHFLAFKFPQKSGSDLKKANQINLHSSSLRLRWRCLRYPSYKRSGYCENKYQNLAFLTMNWIEQCWNLKVGTRARQLSPPKNTSVQHLYFY